MAMTLEQLRLKMKDPNYRYAGAKCKKCGIILIDNLMSADLAKNLCDECERVINKVVCPRAENCVAQCLHGFPHEWGDGCEIPCSIFHEQVTTCVSVIPKIIKNEKLKNRYEILKSQNKKKKK
jgi:hypothetical protein